MAVISDPFPMYKWPVLSKPSVSINHLKINIFSTSSVNALKFLSLLSFLKKKFVFRAGIHKMLFRLANREDLDQTASSEVV